MSMRDTLRDMAEDLSEQLRREAEKLKGKIPGRDETQALSQFLRPNLPEAINPWRRLLEPVVAAAAIGALMTLMSVGAVSLAFFLLAAGLIYAILKHVFGVDFEMTGPAA